MFTVSKFQKADYPLRSIDDIMNDFIKSIKHLKDSFLIPTNLFEK